MTPTLSKEQIQRMLGAPREARPPKPASKRLTTGILLHPPLSDDAVRDIRRRWAAGERIKIIAADHNVTQAAVSLIGSGQRRKDVQ